MSTGDPPPQIGNGGFIPARPGDLDDDRLTVGELRQFMREQRADLERYGTRNEVILKRVEETLLDMNDRFVAVENRLTKLELARQHNPLPPPARKVKRRR